MKSPAKAVLVAASLVAAAVQAEEPGEIQLGLEISLHTQDGERRDERRLTTKITGQNGKTATLSMPAREEGSGGDIAVALTPTLQEADRIALDFRVTEQTADGVTVLAAPNLTMDMGKPASVDVTLADTFDLLKISVTANRSED